jgi:hypothetical protein
MANRLEGTTEGGRRVQVEWILLGFHRSADARVRPPSKALGHEPAGADRPRGRQQVIRALGAQAVRERKLAIESAHVEPRRDRRQLMHHHLGLSR